MKLSVSCPNCGEQFRNIKPEMAGKKARCRCGMIVRLGAAETSPDPGSIDPEEPTDLLNVDLMGDDILADAEPKRAIPAETVVSKPANIERKKTRPAKKKRTQPGRKQRVERTRSRENQAEDQSLFDQSYSDLDEILAGVGDASPVVARPWPDPTGASTRSSTVPTDSDSTQLRTTKTRSTKRRSTVGFLAALGSATLAFWFGIFVAVVRFQIVDGMLLSDLSRNLQNLFSATLGTADVTRGYQILFVSLGWVLWVVAVALVIVGVAQFINAWVKLLVDRQPLRMSDGLAATLGVSGLFLMVALAFAQASFANQQHRLLDEYELPAVAANEQLENVSRLRAEIDVRNKAFTTSLLVGATVPLAIFVFSTMRLFTKAPNSQKN